MSSDPLLTGSEKEGYLATPQPGSNDPEGAMIPTDLPPVIDVHVHLFPEPFFQSLWKWFDRHAWPIRYRMSAEEVIEFLLERGTARLVGLTYAHRPGIARQLNQFQAGLARKYPALIALGTVFPGEAGAEEIIEEAFDLGLEGIKLHAHVQCFDLNGPVMEPVYAACSTRRKPLVMHVGREPKSPAYPCDPYLICGADKLERVLLEYPDLKICVPHLGCDEFESYQRLLNAFENLWVDSAMMLADFFPGLTVPDLRQFRPDRVMYGTDFPNIPYNWDRELKKISGLGLPPESLNRYLNHNALDFFL